MKLYQCEVAIAATLYIKADSAEAAAAIARAWHQDSIEVEGEGVDGRPFDQCMEDDDFTSALSPAMTVGGYPMGDTTLAHITADDMEESE